VLRTTFEFTTTPQRSRRRALPLHRAILEGIAAGDGSRAEEAARTLIADTAADIRRLGAGNGKPRH
jgi:DNA-binding FadR family transcriptional regulator